MTDVPSGTIETVPVEDDQGLVPKTAIREELSSLCPAS